MKSLRGGGFNMGVILSMTYKLKPISHKWNLVTFYSSSISSANFELCIKSWDEAVKGTNAKYFAMMEYGIPSSDSSAKFVR